MPILNYAKERVELQETGEGGQVVEDCDYRYF